MAPLRKELAAIVALLFVGAGRAFAPVARGMAKDGLRLGPGFAPGMKIRGSHWAQDEDEPSFMPKTYVPEMDYPGTLRPGTKPENDPMDSLPQYILHRPPNFLQTPWHIRWGAPHGASVPIDEFVERIGRWYNEEEMEAEERQLQQAASSVLDVLEPDDMLGEDDTSLIESALGIRNDNNGNIGLGAE